MTDVGSALYGVLARGPGNLALSPYSIEAALGMAASGAAGETLHEMLGVLGVSAADEAGSPLAAPGSDEVVLATANQLFGQRGLTWRSAFLTSLSERYDARMEEVDYAGDAGGARTAINDWTAARTHERIREIVPDGVLTRESLLVLVNALYLKAPWADPFAVSATSDADFHLDDGTVVQVPTMHAGLSAGTGAGDGWRSVRLGYSGGELAMTVVLPDEGHLASVEASLASLGCEPLLEATPGRVQLALPRFTFRTAASLGAALAGLGMPLAFTDDADFSAMTTDQPLKISEVLHQVFVAVDEAGTEAAAATAVAMQRAGALATSPTPFVVDRPFLFLIHHRSTRTPLFLGRVADPRS